MLRVACLRGPASSHLGRGLPGKERVRPLLDGQVVGLVQHVPSQGEAVIRPPLDLGGENWGTSKAGLGGWRSKGGGDQGDDGGGAVHGEGVSRGSGCGMMCGMMSATLVQVLKFGFSLTT